LIPVADGATGCVKMLSFLFARHITPEPGGMNDIDRVKQC
jgi:hypothetical protein